MNDLKWDFVIKDGKWYWQAKYNTGQIAAESEQGHSTKSKCIEEAKTFGYKEITEQFLVE